MERPEGIIITISAGMLKEKGLPHWTRNFLEAMATDEMTYWMRLGNKPKHEPMYVYLLIGRKIRYRALFVKFDTGHMTFTDGKEMTARTWCVLCGPLAKPQRGSEPEMKGFRGFRYTQQLF